MAIAVQPRTFCLAGVLIMAFLAVACRVDPISEDCEPQVSSVFEGLTEPRGLTVGSDGAVYVAEVGPPEAGGRIIRIDDEKVTTLLAGLPVFTHATEERVGASAVALRHEELYVLIGEGSQPPSSSLLLTRGEGEFEVVADLHAHIRIGHPKYANRIDPAPIPSNPFAVAYHDALDLFFVVDSGVNALLSVGSDGETDIVATWDDNPVPTGVAVGPDGDLYVALFSPLPYLAGSGSVVRVTPAGEVSEVVADLTTPIGVAFDAAGVMYVLEFSKGFDPEGPELFGQESGRLLRVGDGGNEVIVNGLAFPTGLAVAPSGAIYLTNHGGLSAPHTGAVLRLEPCPAS